MAFPFLAVAVDFDGTLTTAGRPGQPVLDAIRETRAEGRWVLLVTGRILAELRDVYPDVAKHFDLIVAENGAVLAGEDGVRDLVPSVAPELGDALAHRDVAVRRGRVLLACAARDAGVVVEEVVADAAETTLCAWLSVSTFAGLVAFAVLGWTWIDAVAGFVIAGFAVNEGREAWEGELVSDE